MKLARKWRVALNLVSFQVAWFACVLSAARGAPAVGVMAVVAAVALHFALSDARTEDLLLVAVSLVVGFLGDTALARTGLVVYAAAGAWSNWAPWWILALWALFATTLREPLAWLHGRWLLAACLGAVGGALSYAAAQRLGACRLPNAELAMVVLALGWAVITPALLMLAQWQRNGRMRRVGLHPGP